MRRIFALALLAAVGTAAPAEVASRTWQQANARSAEIIRAHGSMTEAADFAQQAFDLYPGQTRQYDATVHAQLLLNLSDARARADGVRAALPVLERGMAAVEKAAGAKEPLLVDVWREVIRLGWQLNDTDVVDAAYERAVALAESLWGPVDPRVVGLRLDWTNDLRAHRGASWAEWMLAATLEQAREAGADHPRLALVELVLAKLALERGSLRNAIGSYERLIAALEQRDDPEYRSVLQSAYGQVAYAYKRRGSRAAERTARERLARSLGEGSSELMPLVRTSPRHTGGEGFVELLISVDASGAVSDVAVVDSEPPGRFDASAIEAVRHWIFRPRIVDGRPVPDQGLQRIEFRHR